MADAISTDDVFLGAQGRHIFWRSWAPAGAEPGGRAVITLAHGLGEHSGRYRHVADRLLAEGYAVHALDHHGHGRSEGVRARISFADAVADLDQLITLAAARHPRSEQFLLGHSMGGAIALRYAIDHGDRLNGLILSGALVQVDGRELVQTVGKLVASIAPGLPLARLDPHLISRDPAVVEAYLNDPLVYHHPVPAGTVGELLRYAESLPQDLRRITLPTLILYGTADRLCAPAGSLMVSEGIDSTDVTIKAFTGLFHEILNEPERNRVIDEICRWIAAHVPAPAHSGAG